MWRIRARNRHSRHLNISGTIIIIIITTTTTTSNPNPILSPSFILNRIPMASRLSSSFISSRGLPHFHLIQLRDRSGM